VGNVISSPPSFQAAPKTSATLRCDFGSGISRAGFAAPGDDDRFAGFDAFDQGGKMGLGFGDVHLSHDGLLT